LSLIVAIGEDLAVFDPHDRLLDVLQAAYLDYSRCLPSFLGWSIYGVSHGELPPYLELNQGGILPESAAALAQLLPLLQQGRVLDLGP